VPWMAGRFLEGENCTFNGRNGQISMDGWLQRRWECFPGARRWDPSITDTGERADRPKHSLRHEGPSRHRSASSTSPCWGRMCSASVR
jgi:hypothetical protein